jgi:hypothetical protein
MLTDADADLLLPLSRCSTAHDPTESLAIATPASGMRGVSARTAAGSSSSSSMESASWREIRLRNLFQQHTRAAGSGAQDNR